MQEKNELLFRDYNGDPMQVGMAGSRWGRLEQEWELHSHSVICSYPMDDGLEQWQRRDCGRDLARMARHAVPVTFA